MLKDLARKNILSPQSVVDVDADTSTNTSPFHSFFFFFPKQSAMNSKLCGMFCCVVVKRGFLSDSMLTALKPFHQWWVCLT